ncbi:MAG: hypothetical protein LIR46_02005 [Bacteroidota bacterium]|nr:hypothetical protein [Bacteroidota bacterium]
MNKKINLINKKIKFLFTNFNFEDTISEAFEIDEEEENVRIAFPIEEEFTDYSFDDFISYTDSIEQIEYDLDDGWVRCGKYLQQIIDIKDYTCDYSRIPVYHNGSYEISVKDSPLLVALIATKVSGYNEDYGIYPCCNYIVVEVKYYDTSFVKKETEIISQYLYDVSRLTNNSVLRTSFKEFPDDSYLDDEPEVLLKELTPYSCVMDQYVKAIHNSEEKYKFLELYKILEFFAPSIANRGSYSAINDILSNHKNGTFTNSEIDKLLKIGQENCRAIKDDKLVNTILKFMGISKIEKFIPKETSCQKLNQLKKSDVGFDRLKPKELNNFISKLANVIYHTRCQIAHGKSNYELKGDECSEDILDELNLFMERLCQELIKWNGSLPEERRL